MFGRKGSVCRRTLTESERPASALARKKQRARRALESCFSGCRFFRWQFFFRVRMISCDAYAKRFSAALLVDDGVVAEGLLSNSSVEGTIRLPRTLWTPSFAGLALGVP